MTSKLQELKALLEPIYLAGQSKGVMRLWQWLEPSKGLEENQANWLLNAIGEYILQPPGSNEPLESFLGIESSFQLKLTIRNYHLFQCAVLIRAASHHCSLWEASGHLLKEISSFQGKPFDRVKAGEREIKNAIEGHLYDALIVCKRIPRTQEQLHNIFRELEKSSVEISVNNGFNDHHSIRKF